MYIRKSGANYAAMIFGLAMVMAWSGASRAQETEAKKAVQKPLINFQSVYLTDPIGNAHRIIVQGELGGAAKVTLDGNTCTLTQFGDPAICTEIAFQPFDVKLVQLRIADPTGQGRRLFRIEGELQPSDSSYFLVVPRRRSQAHRLVVDLGNDHRRVVALESIQKPAPKPALCKNAEYRAEQSDGKVVIYASGQHNTSGWKTDFEQLPIRIFPPQFRLVCQAPAGQAAQAITPFDVQTSFASDQAVAEVTVHDADGQHKIKVQQK